MDKQTFTTELNTKVAELIGDVKFDAEIINRGQRFLDIIENVTGDPEAWDPTFAEHFMAAIEQEHLFNGTVVEEGVAKADTEITDDLLTELLSDIQKTFETIPESARNVMLEAGRVTQQVLEVRPA
jgi:hypothetical protein